MAPWNHVRRRSGRVVVILQPPEAAPVANVTTFRDGKVIERAHYRDPPTALAAAGLG